MRTDDAKDLPLPTRMSEQAAGFDLCAKVDGSVSLHKGMRRLIPTGIRIALPCGYEAQVRPRSGLALRHGVGLLNAPGTIDADYRGEVHVLLINHGNDDIEIKRGDRIAQLVVNRVETVDFTEVGELPATKRGDGGFGHTGIEGARE